MDQYNPITSQSPSRGPFLRSFYKAIHDFHLTERVAFYVLLAVAVASGLILLANLNNRFLVAVPDYGGTITEGIIGVPRFVNPVLAISDADKDLTSLVFSGLLRATSQGELIGDLSQSHEISADGRTYTFTLKDDIYFHDGKRITTDDVEFTIQKIQDPTIKSPKRLTWEGVVVQKIDSHKISFTLKQPYAPFIQNFTIGIIPYHVWKNIPSDEFSFSELNVTATGNGPYKVRKVERNSYGLPTFYVLKAFKDYALNEPFVSNIILSFYQNEKELVTAFANDEIDSMSGVSPENLKSLNPAEDQIIASPLPRVFGVFFNQSQATVFLNNEVREALAVAIDKDAIVNDIFAGYATTIDSPVPVTTSTATSTNADVLTSATSTQTNTSPLSHADQAITILTKAGWTLNTKTGIMEKKISNGVVPLSFSLATGDAPELKKAAEKVKRDWEKIGAAVTLKFFEIGSLNQNVIRPRKFDALLFGEVVGREFDLYPFWHSSQRNDPGLNIALYANITADKILENLRLTQDRNERIQKASEFVSLFKKDLPAVFIYSPDFIYVLPKKLQNISIGELTEPGERFLNVNEWYMETSKVWKFFAYEE